MATTFLNITCNNKRCNEVAQILRRMKIPEPIEDVPPLPFTQEQEANFWFFLAAICHQTSPVGKPPLIGLVDGVERRGWDFLVHAFRVSATFSKSLLNPSEWKSMTGARLKLLFNEMLTEADERASLIVDLGERLESRGWNSIYIANDVCRQQITGDSPNLLELLSDFRAFSDPVEKKSSFFLALMQNSGLWRYRDGEKLPAPVDYHEVRGHLRIGTVHIDPALRGKIQLGIELSVDEDVALRYSIREAIHRIAEAVGNSPNALHYFFWNLFRTYCVRHTPFCDGQAFDRLPDVYKLAVITSGSGSVQCPFVDCCDSAYKVPAIDEHRTSTEYY